MKSRIHIRNYISTCLILGLFICLFIGVSLDETVNNTLLWYLAGLSVIGMTLLFYKIYSKIPSIKIDNQRVFFNSKKKEQSFEISEIISVQPIDSDIDFWYTRRGGMLIETDKANFKIPFHIYSNERELLQKLYGHELKRVIPKVKINPKSLRYLKYLYRNVYSLFFLISIPFIWLLFCIRNHTYISVIFLSILPVLLLTTFKKTTKYIKIDFVELKIFDPFFMIEKKYSLVNIENVNSKRISAGKSSIKGLTLMLTDKNIITIPAELNKQAELDLIAKRMNSRN